MKWLVPIGFIFFGAVAFWLATDLTVTFLKDRPKTYVYFISYRILNGFAQCEIKTDHPIDTYEHILSVREEIIKLTGNQDLIILNPVLLGVLNEPLEQKENHDVANCDQLKVKVTTTREESY